ncbi:hypothetical protein LIER_11762 [Lithospermum erythrorhizon]|uniref:Uncharacterized protein n=1 Tax=Lithospermum erythrorhizon TaxID=34254 RepID=A0AAV3PPB0_LITER
MEEALSKRDELTELCQKQRSDRESLLADARKASESEEYRTLLKGDTMTLFHNFCQKVVADYLDISSHFTNFVTTLGEDYVVSLFDNLPKDSEDASGSDSREDEVGDES